MATVGIDHPLRPRYGVIAGFHLQGDVQKLPAGGPEKLVAG